MSRIALTAGSSSKKFDKGGVAPTASPAVKIKVLGLLASSARK